MRNFLLISLLVVFATSCKKKEPNHVLSVGETDGMEVTDYNLTVSAGPYPNPSQVGVDLNGDGVNDIKFVYTLDTINSLYQELQYTLELQSSYNFVFKEVPNSEWLSFYPTDTVDDYYGTFPRRTITLLPAWEYCNGCYDTQLMTTAENSKYGHKYMSEDDFQSSFSSTAQYLKVFRSSYLRLNYDFTNNGDSLIGRAYHYPNLLQSPTFNSIFYLSFKYQLGLEVKYGWIELIIDTNKQLHIIRSAISEEAH